MESFLLDSRVGATGMSMALFSFLQDISCRGNVESRPLSRTMFWWPEGHDSSSSEGDEGHSVSQGNLCEMNGDMNFTSSNGSAFGISI